MPTSQNNYHSPLVEKITTIDRAALNGDYIESLIAPPKERKKRNCNKCGVVFISANFGNCFCGACAAQNSKASKRAEYTYR